MIKYLILYIQQFDNSIPIEKFESLLKVLDYKYKFIPSTLSKDETHLLHKFEKDEFLYTFTNYLKTKNPIPLLEEIAYLFYLEYVKLFSMNYKQYYSYQRAEKLYLQIKDKLKETLSKREVKLMDISFITFCTIFRKQLTGIVIPNQIQNKLFSVLNKNHTTHYNRNLHIGMIMDGNRRFQKENNTPVSGHIYGAMATRNIIEAAFQHPLIKELTLYTLSIDNLTKRDPKELKIIYNLMSYFFSQLTLFPIPIKIIGSIEKLPLKIQKLIRKLEWRDIKCYNFKLNLAIAYDSDDHENPRLSDMNMVIRTGFVKRLSGFFPIETRYAELFFVDKFWPQFTSNDLHDIIEQYYFIDRRFGK